MWYTVLKMFCENIQERLCKYERMAEEHLYQDTIFFSHIVFAFLYNGLPGGHRAGRDACARTLRGV